MLRVPIEKIEPGMVLARPVPMPNDPLRYLLQRDIEVPPSVIPRLAEFGIREVWIRHRNLEFLEAVIDEELGDQQRELYVHVRRNFEAVMAGTAAQLDVNSFQSSISSLFEYLKRSRGGNVLLQKLDAYDNFLMSHSTNVCYVALLLGMKLERYLIDERSLKSARDAKDLRQLGLGCLLHDVGKMRIPRDVLNKPGRLSDEEMELIRQHPTLGYEMVAGHTPPMAAQVVLNHHQRWDGKGYPERVDRRTGEKLPPLSGRQIPVFCRIATIADVYDAATSQRCYKAAKPPVQVLHEIRSWGAGMFDPVIERAFHEIIPPFPIGQVVRLSNDMEAVVVDFNPRYSTRPKVQCLRAPDGQPFADPSLEELDLAMYPDLSIVAVGETDVRPYVATLETPRAPQPALA